MLSNNVCRFKLLDFLHWTKEMRDATMHRARREYNNYLAPLDSDSDDSDDPNDSDDPEDSDDPDDPDDSGVEEVPKKPLPAKAMNAKWDLEDFLGEPSQANQTSTTVTNVCEFESYLALPRELDKNLDILDWWRKHAMQFPRLSIMARQYLGAPATSASAERTFSKAGRLHDDFKKRTSENTMEDTLIVSVNYKRPRRYV